MPVSCQCCVLSGKRSLCRADHLSRESVVCMGVIVKALLLHGEGGERYFARLFCMATKLDLAQGSGCSRTRC